MIKEENEMSDKELRTSSYRGQEAYDRMLADCSISSLRFLSEKYEDDLYRYRKNHDLDNKEFYREYRDMQQRKKMIDEELTTRIMNESATKTKSNTYFDSTTGHIIDEHTGSILGTADFDEDEEYVSVRDFDGNIINQYNKPCKPIRKRKDIYDDWEY